MILYFKEKEMTEFNFISADWKRVKNHCRTTVGKEFTENEPSESFKKKLLISEHTPIRLIEIDWSWKGIKSWVATEWSRHKFEKFITSQRNDRQNNYDRNKAPQDAPVNYDGYANAQNLIDSWRKRLCNCATVEARTLAQDFKIELQKINPELASVLVPNCIYRCGCPEFKCCGFWKSFEEFCLKNDVDVFDIECRYNAYTEFFNKSYNKTEVNENE